ncbi:oligonucleotide/oligosaccharide-binding fold domain-containing protein, partial [Glaesserella parasuis]|uniref:oligonucleotide/oligosaccharide-binding fold domain-containing protein n=1 Tax=Glaesserella parasuis TaxID=738 RepID=UPI001F1D8378
KMHYLGARNAHFYLFPNSVLFKKQPKWLMAAELIKKKKKKKKKNVTSPPPPPPAKRKEKCQKCEVYHIKNSKYVKFRSKIELLR